MGKARRGLRPTRRSWLPRRKSKLLPKPGLRGPNPDGTVSTYGTYHPEDEALLPWFMRTAPNTLSEPTQSVSPNVGRYTFMGDLNPFPGSRQPATGC